MDVADASCSGSQPLDPTTIAVVPNGFSVENAMSLSSSSTYASIPQSDGPMDAQSGNLSLGPQSSQNAGIDLLPYCTTQPPLSREQTIALSDVAGSLREIVFLALAALMDDKARQTLEQAVGQEVTAGIVEFWTDEWVADM